MPCTTYGQLWMGHLVPYMTESFIMGAFRKVGEDPIDIRLMRKKNFKYANYCFVNFATEEHALDALHRLNGLPIPDTSPVAYFHLNCSKHLYQGSDFRIWVEDLSLDVNTYSLYRAFASNYTSIISAKVFVDKLGISKGFGLVRFGNEDEQRAAMCEMNGFIGLGIYPIRTSEYTSKYISPSPWDLNTFLYNAPVYNQYNNTENNQYNNSTNTSSESYYYNAEYNTNNWGENYNSSYYQQSNPQYYSHTQDWNNQYNTGYNYEFQEEYKQGSLCNPEQEHQEKEVIEKNQKEEKIIQEKEETVQDEKFKCETNSFNSRNGYENPNIVLVDNKFDWGSCNLNDETFYFNNEFNHWDDSYVEVKYGTDINNFNNQHLEQTNHNGNSQKDLVEYTHILDIDKLNHKALEEDCKLYDELENSKWMPSDELMSMHNY